MFNRWMPKIGLTLIALILAVSCGTQPEHQITSDRPENLKGQILVWVETFSPSNEAQTQTSSAETTLTEIVENFQDLHPDVRVLVKFLPTSQIWQQFESDVNRGAGADMLLVQATPEILRVIQTGALRAIEDSEIDSSQFRPEALNQVRYQGQLYGIPLFLSTQVLCYNRDKVSELPSTLPELLEQARAGNSVAVQAGFAETFWGAGTFGGQLFDEGGRLILTRGGGWARWMTWLKDAQNEPNFILSDEAGQLQDAFAGGRLAYLTCEPQWLPYFQEKLGRDSLGTTLLPGMENQPATPILQSYGLLFNRYSSTPQHQLAIELARFMSNVQQQKQVQIEVPLISGNKHVRIDRTLFPLQSTLLQQARTAVALALDNAEKIARLKESGNSLYQQAINGDLAPEEAAIQIERAVNPNLDRGN